MSRNFDPYAPVTVRCQNFPASQGGTQPLQNSQGETVINENQVCLCSLTLFRVCNSKVAHVFPHGLYRSLAALRIGRQAPNCRGHTFPFFAT